MSRRADDDEAVINQSRKAGSGTPNAPASVLAKQALTGSRQGETTLSHPLGEGCDEMLTKEELAAKLKVTVRTVENWQHAGHLPYVKIACMVRFHWPEVVEHLKANFKVCRRGVVRPRE